MIILSQMLQPDVPLISGINQLFAHCHDYFAFTKMTAQVICCKATKKPRESSGQRHEFAFYLKVSYEISDQK